MARLLSVDESGTVTGFSPTLKVRARSIDSEIVFRQ
jgi:hypothetical protein